MQLLMDEAGRAASFRELDPFGERHGSWQRTIHAWSALRSPTHTARQTINEQGGPNQMIEKGENFSPPRH